MKRIVIVVESRVNWDNQKNVKKTFFYTDKIFKLIKIFRISQHFRGLSMKQT